MEVIVKICGNYYHIFLTFSDTNSFWGSYGNEWDIAESQCWTLPDVILLLALIPFPFGSYCCNQFASRVYLLCRAMPLYAPTLAATLHTRRMHMYYIHWLLGSAVQFTHLRTAGICVLSTRCPRWHRPHTSWVLFLRYEHRSMLCYRNTFWRTHTLSWCVVVWFPKGVYRIIGHMEPQARNRLPGEWSIHTHTTVKNPGFIAKCVQLYMHELLEKLLSISANGSLVSSGGPLLRGIGISLCLHSTTLHCVRCDGTLVMDYPTR